MGSQRVAHDWTTNTFTFPLMQRRNTKSGLLPCPACRRGAQQWWGWWCQVSASLSGHCGSLHVQSWGGAWALGERKGTSLRGLPPTANLCQQAVFRKQGCWAQGWLCGLFWAVDPMREKLSSCFFLTLARFTWFLWLMVSREVVWGLLRGEAAFHVCWEFSHPRLVTWWSRLNLYRLFRENAESSEHLCMLFYWKGYSYTVKLSGTVNIIFPIRWDC